MAKNKRWLLIAIYFGIAIYVLPMFPHSSSANELTRWATAASIVEKGSFDIGWTGSLIGPNVDTARIGDNIYSNKAPGTAILAVPFYAIARVFVGPPNASNIRVTWFVMRFAISTLPLLLLAIWLYKRGTDEFGLAALLFASPLFIYSLLFFSHVLVAVVVYVAFRILYDGDYRSNLRTFVAGSLAGVAVISEFPAIVPAGVFAIGILFMDKHQRFSQLAYFVIGAVPFALLLLVYNNALFGSPFSFSYAHESFPEWAEVANTGVYGIGFPTLSNFFLLLLSPSRGLFFFAPVLILGLVGFLSPGERSTLRHRIKFIAVILTILVMTGHEAAHGGWAFGPRYLVLIVPLLTDSLLDRSLNLSEIWSALLFGVSLLFCTIPIFTFPFAPPEFSSPHNDLWLPLIFQDGWYVPTLANVVGASSSGWTLVPIGLGVAVIVYLVSSSARSPLRFVLGFASGLALIALYIALPLRSDEDQFRRATIEERFFRPADRLDALEQRAISNQDLATARRILDYRWNIADTRSYAPDSFPYETARDVPPSPTALMKQAIEFQRNGELQKAEDKLLSGKSYFPFAACEFGTNLAVIYYTTGRKDQARMELEGVQPQVFPWSRPDCTRSRDLLRQLTRENPR